MSYVLGFLLALTILLPLGAVPSPPVVGLSDPFVAPGTPWDYSSESWHGIPPGPGGWGGPGWVV